MEAIREYRAHRRRFFQVADFWEEVEDSWGLRALFGECLIVLVIAGLIIVSISVRVVIVLQFRPPPPPFFVERHGDVFVGPGPRSRLWSLLEASRALQSWDGDA